MPLAHDVNAPVDIRRPVVPGFCDRCNRKWPLSRLDFQYDWRGNSLQNLGIRVCWECDDEPQPNGRKPILIGPDPYPVRDPRPGYQTQESASGTGFVTDGGSQFVDDSGGRFVPDD